MVRFTDDFAADAARRDLTINAMSCDGAGRLFDYFGGRADLAAGRVRFVGEPAARIAEDYLRILRFFRFFAHYGRPPADPGALAATAAAAPELAGLSGERIQAEMLRLLGRGRPAAGAPADGRRRRARAGAPRPARARSSRPPARLRARRRPDPAACRAAAPAARGRRDAGQRSPRAGASPTATPSGSPRSPRQPLPPLAAPAAEHRRALYRYGADRYGDLLRLAATDQPDPAALAAALAEAAAWRPRKLPLTGDDLIAHGVPPGPRLGALLAEVEAWWLAQDLAPDHAACLAHARRLLEQTA